MFGTTQPTAKDYKDGRTKQSFRDETDINQILKRAQKSGTISHLNKYEARYGDFSGFDFFEAQLKLAQGATMFADLPVEIRREFNQSPAQFFDYVNDPANKDDLKKLLPALAEPGRQNLNVKTLDADEEKAAVEAAKPPEGDPVVPAAEKAPLVPGGPPEAPKVATPEPPVPVT